MVDAVTGGLLNMAEAGNVPIQLRDQQNNIVQAGSRHVLRQGHRLIAADQQPNQWDLRSQTAKPSGQE